jgi:hypothetical protein
MNPNNHQKWADLCCGRLQVHEHWTIYMREKYFTFLEDGFAPLDAGFAFVEAGLAVFVEDLDLTLAAAAFAAVCGRQ